MREMLATVILVLLVSILWWPEIVGHELGRKWLAFERGFQQAINQTEKGK